MRRTSSRSGIARKNREHRYRIRFWKDRLKGVPAFIVGCAPSVLDHDLSLLKDFFTIGINRSFKLDSFCPTVLFWQDISFFRTEADNIHNLDCIKVCRDIADPQRLYYNFHHKPGEYKFDSEKPFLLSGSGSSGVLSTELCFILGNSPIILLGMDGKLGSNGDQDYYGANIYWLPTTEISLGKSMRTLKDICPIEIINCSDTDLWPRQNLKDVINRIGNEYAFGRKEYTKRILGTT